MTPISFSDTLYFNNDNELSYSTDNSNWTAVTSFPVTLTYTGGSTGNVYFNTDITLSTSSNKYFIFGSANITVYGQSHLITLNGIEFYPGLFNNGADGVNGYSYITIQDMSCAAISSALNGSAGWFGQSYFSNGATDNSFNNLTSSGAMNGGVTFASCGGICGSYAAYNYGSLTITNCCSTGNIAAVSSGGICGSHCGRNHGTVTISNCYSTGNMQEQQCGGICGDYAGRLYGTVTITNCYSTGNMLSYRCGGICGYDAAVTYGNVTITNCYSTGTITGTECGGICASYLSENNGSATILNCYSTGEIAGTGSGGIIGSYGAHYLGVVNISKCYSLGTISGAQCGGIVGSGFLSNTSASVTCSIANCYSRGNITNATCGGICGYDFGNGNGSSCIIDISNCYSYGTLFDASCGAICASTSSSADVTVNITNCYGVNGPLYSTSQGTNVSFTTTTSGVGSGTWSYTDALSYLTGTPTYSGSTLTAQGSTWGATSLTDLTAPYVLGAVPLISGISPSSGVNGAAVAITGIALDNSTVVTFASTTATVSQNTGTQIDCIAPNAGTVGLVTVTVTTTYGSDTTDFTYNVTCFNEGTKILCLNKQGEEEYIKIENLRKGDLVKTCLNGYKAIDCIGKSVLENPDSTDRTKDRLYILKNDKYPELFEDLIITGCHSVLVDNITDEQRKKTEEMLGRICVTDRKYRLIACLDDKAQVYAKGGKYTIYHLALENDDYYMNYGIYANGLLVETTSKRWIRELSGMTFLE